MPLNIVAPPYPVFTDRDGTPLENGYVYLGEPGKDPETNPIQVFWDTALTVPAVQPIRTVYGYLSRNGTPSKLYANDTVSLTVKNSKQEVVFSSLTNIPFDPSTSARVEVERFTGNGTQTAFVLTSAPVSENNTQVYINGVYQNKDGYSISGNTLTFTQAPPAVGSDIEVVTFETYTIGQTDASFVSYTPAGVGAVTTNVQAKLRETVSVKDFGAVGDGVTDDSAAIQAAVEYAINNKQSLVFPSATYAISNTILIPNNDGTSQLTIDGQDSVIRPSVDVTIFASARYSSGALIPTYGEPIDVNFCFGITLCNFSFASVGSVLLLEPAIEIQNWNTGCKLENIISRVHDQFLKARSCFYCDYDRLWCQTSTSTGAARFLFDSNNNLNTVSNCVSADSTKVGIGYKFNGLVTALNFVNNSIEGVAVGVEFAGEVRGANVLNCYGENWGDVAVKFSSNFSSAVTIDGGYWNFGNDANAYLIEYVEGPINNIKITKSNDYNAMPSDANLFKNVSTTFGYNLLTFDRAAKSSTSINDFLLDNTDFSPEIDYQQTVSQPGLRTEVVNKYAKGVYAGQYTNGFTSANGFTWVNTSSATLQLTTRIVPSDTQLIYVNILVNVSGVGLVNIKGQFVGNDFYEYNGTALTLTTTLNVSTVGGYIQINGTMAATISTPVVGEVRLI